MKFTLKDYQETAVAEVLKRVTRAQRDARHGDLSAFSLTAATGAGKTVMAAAVFEALFAGNDDFDFEADPSAVVLWFSDDPSLNEQTRFRLLEACDRIHHADLVVVENTFCQEAFRPGKVYFLNTQKLSKNSLLVRGHEPSEGDEETLLDVRPDNRQFTIWDTIRNTINDPDLTLYLVLDEAHRGLGSTSATLREKGTIVSRLINGSGDVPPVPIVWGISATIERFRKAMEVSQKHTMLPSVEVDSDKVQASGLLKDTIVLDMPAETGDFETVLVRRAARHLVEIGVAWDDYATAQELATGVSPLMVLQVPNTPDHDDIGRYLDVIGEEMPNLTYDAFAHVLGDHTHQTFGGHRVPHVSPEHVQERSEIRVLIAKDAISTGWDCPRAEVFVSFRAATDKTHITQLLGRMVRTPLARRIPGNDRLNSVDCILPKFNRQAAEQVVELLSKGGGDGEDGNQPNRRVLINPQDYERNAAVSDDVWELLKALPSESLPKKEAKPIKRLTALAHELAVDRIVQGAGAFAHAELHKAINAARTRFADEIATARDNVLTVEGETLTVDIATKGKSYNDFVEDADIAVIDEAYRRAGRIISPDLARTYVNSLDNPENGPDPDERILEGRTVVGALGLVPEIKEYLEAEAEKLAQKWLAEHRIAIKDLSDERQAIYQELISWSREPENIGIIPPTKWMQMTSAKNPDGTVATLPLAAGHLLADAAGLYPFEGGSSWEIDVLEREKSRPGFVAWYRNPQRATQEALGVAYEIGGIYKIMRPDFIFFARKANGDVVADIVDPHGHHLSDSVPKLRGLVRFARLYPSAFRRIDAVAKIGDKLRVLDLLASAVQAAVESATDANSLYSGDFGQDY
ncbi:MAG: DEAD/DEAH box helicase family protein [Fimbriimonadaceae bacterium]|nr:DEAD/DEAH box helicase family protein [Fimbriimonadaceae bacterium]